MNVTDIARLQRLTGKLLVDLSERTLDISDSSIPEWLREAQRLGVQICKCKFCDKIVADDTEVCSNCVPAVVESYEHFSTL